MFPCSVTPVSIPPSPSGRDSLCPSPNVQYVYPCPHHISPIFGGLRSPPVVESVFVSIHDCHTPTVWTVGDSSCELDPSLPQTPSTPLSAPWVPGSPRRTTHTRFTVVPVGHGAHPLPVGSPYLGGSPIGLGDVRASRGRHSVSVGLWTPGPYL